MEAIKPLGIKWNGQFDASVVRRPDLLRLAKESGCFTGLVGIESVNPQNLTDIGKSGSGSRISYEEIAAVFKEHKIPLIASVMFGMDGDTEESIMHTIEQFIKHQIPFVYPWILTPMPRTEVYDRYLGQDRIMHHDYSLFDHWHCVIKPHSISAERLQQVYWRAMRRFYGMENIARSFFHNPDHKIHLALMQLWYRARICKGLHPISY